MDGIDSGNFFNFRPPDIQVGDFAGPRVILEKGFKLVIHGGVGEDAKRELFDIRYDPAESNNLVHEFLEVGANLEEKLKIWQQSVFESLMGNHY
jgi:arylsulfatase A-like enzyme